MTFTENWFDEVCQVALTNLAWSTRDVEGRVIEVGCWEGRSTCALANAAYPSVVHAIDTFVGSPGEISAELAAERDIRAAFERNIGELTRGNVEIYQQNWREYFAADLTPIRFLHIDAEHTYTEVFDNIQAALPFMAPGGIICGDDVHHPGILEAATDALGAVGTRTTLWVWHNRA